MPRRELRSYAEKMGMTDVGQRYWAFLSYSHQDNRETRGHGKTRHIQWAEWLHNELETYRVPSEFRANLLRNGESMPERFFPVFQDEKELPVNADLSQSIRTALERSRYLIVICSPRSAGSRYVNEEVRYFKQLGRGNFILTLIIDGEPNATDGNKEGFTEKHECFCPALRHPIDAAGEVELSRRDAQEPIAGDARIQHHGKLREPQLDEFRTHAEMLRLTKLKLLAGLMEVGFDELAQRDKVRELVQAQERLKRARKIAAGFALISLVALLAAIFAWSQRSTAIANAKVAKENEAKVHRANSVSDFVRAGEHSDAQRWDDTLAFLAHGQREDPRNSAVAGRIFSLLTYQSFALPVGQTMEHSSWVRTASFSPDGRRLLTVSSDASPGYEGLAEVRIWDVSTGLALGPPRQFRYGVQVAEFTSGGILIGSRGKKGLQPARVELWDPLLQAPLHPAIALESGLSDCKSSSLTKRLVIIPGDGPIKMWDLEAWKEIANKTTVDSASNVRFSPDGRRMLLYNHQAMQIWDVMSFSGASHAIVCDGASEQIVDIAFDKNWDRAVFITNAKEMQFWDLKTGLLAGKPVKIAHIYRDLQMSPDGAWVAGSFGMASSRGGIETYAWSNQAKCGYVETSHGVNAIEISPDSRSIAGTKLDNSVQVWSMLRSTGTRRFFQGGPEQAMESHRLSPMVENIRLRTDRNFELHLSDRPPSAVHFSPDGKRIVIAGGSAHDRGNAQIWGISDGRAVAERAEHPAAIRTAAYSPDGLSLVTTCGDPNVRIWDAQTLKPLRAPLTHPAIVKTAAFSPDGMRVVTAGADGFVRVWNVGQGTEICAFQNEGPVEFAAFSSDGRRLVIAGRSYAQCWWRLCDAATALPIHDSIKAGEEFTSLAFSPDGKQLLVSGTSFGGLVASAQDGSVLWKIPAKGEGGFLNDLAWNHDGKVIAAARGVEFPKAAGTLQLHQSGSGTNLGLPVSFDRPLRRLLFSTDGSRLATATWGDNDAGELQLWNPDTRGPVTEPIACNRSCVALSRDSIRFLESGDQEFRINDVSSGRLVVGPLNSPIAGSLYNSPFLGSRLPISFSPSGQAVALGTDDGVLRQWKLLSPDEIPPPWLADLAEAVAGKHLDNGVLRQLPSYGAAAHKDLRAKVSGSPARWDKWLAWFYADRTERTVGPFSDAIRKDYAAFDESQNLDRKRNPDEAMQLGVYHMAIPMFSSERLDEAEKMVGQDRRSRYDAAEAKRAPKNVRVDKFAPKPPSDAEVRAALQTLEELAAIYSTGALASLGGLYLEGTRLPQDLAKARKLFTAAAQGGDARAMLELAEMALEGKGGPKDALFGEFLYRACLSLPYSFETQPLMEGYYGEPRPALVKRLIEELAESGNPHASWRLGQMLWNGKYVERDSARALHFIRHAAESGLPVAWNALQRMERGAER